MKNLPNINNFAADEIIVLKNDDEIKVYKKEGITDETGTPVFQWVQLKITIIDDKKDIICKCGAILNYMNSEWRFNGKNWEHYHGYPIGHVAVGE